MEELLKLFSNSFWLEQFPTLRTSSVSNTILKPNFHLNQNKLFNQMSSYYELLKIGQTVFRSQAEAGIVYMQAGRYAKHKPRREWDLEMQWRRVNHPTLFSHSFSSSSEPAFFSWIRFHCGWLSTILSTSSPFVPGVVRNPEVHNMETCCIQLMFVLKPVVSIWKKSVVA